MLTLISHFSLFSPFASIRDQAAVNRHQFYAARAIQGKKPDQQYARMDFFADFAFFAIRRHRTPRPSVPHSRIPAGIGGSVKGRPCRVTLLSMPVTARKLADRHASRPLGRAPRPLTFAAWIPAINLCGRETEMTPSGACSGNIPARKSRERRREKRQRRRSVRPRGAFFVSLSPGVISKSQPTFRGHTLTRVPPHGWRVAPPLRTPEKAKRPKGGKL
jgi:hypothetical protein